MVPRISIRTIVTICSKQHPITPLYFTNGKFSILFPISRFLLSQTNPCFRVKSLETQLTDSQPIQLTMENQGETQQPHLVLSHKLFLLTHPDVQDIEKVRLKEEVLTTIKSDGNYSPSLRSVINYCAEYNLNRLISCFLFCRYGSVV